MRIYSEPILTRLAPGTRDLIDRACARHGVRVSDYLREAVIARLAADGLPIPPAQAKRRLNLAPAAIGEREPEHV